ncbi:MAG: glycine cleavage system protein H [Chlorobi bacterium]|nr:glycine cleavage system protein H [Chlorobiota bacterium]
MTVLLIGATFITFIIIDYFVRKKVSESAEELPATARAQPTYRRMPAGAFLHPGHTWLTIRENGCVRIGIDDFAASALGAIDVLKLPKVNAEVKADSPLLSLKRGKREARFISPVDGEVVATNDYASPTRLPGEWLVEIKPRRLEKALKNMRIAEAARQWLQAEKNRFTDFLAVRQGGAAPVLQDGGEPVPGILARMDDSAWETFQREFLERTTTS